jgi:hypothetical protein
MLILTFEMVPQEVYQEYIWDWTEKEELEYDLVAVGVDSRIFMLSMGVPFYVFALLLACLILTLMLKTVVLFTCQPDDPAIDIDLDQEDEFEGG